jgi:uncharacterized cupredoxin-like copper-binding protein
MQQKPHNRIFTFVAAGATVAIAAALIAVGAPAASAAPRTINVSGVITAFTPKTINVDAGEQVSICLTSKDTDHDLTISDLGFKVVAPKGGPVCKTLTAPAKAGSHKFICSIPGHEQAGMVGSLVVAAASGGAPAPAPAPGAEKAPAPAPAPGAAPQVQGQVPSGGVQTGGGSTAGLTHVSLLTLGGGLLIAAMMTGLLGWVARRD